jgi:hypothetical protein
MTPTSKSLPACARTAVAACLVLTLAGCGARTANGGSGRDTDSPSAQSRCAQQGGFALSLASDTGGQPTPNAAATWFAAHGGIASLPAQGWRVVDQDKDGATLRSGASTLHVVQGSDQTWQVDSGTSCA